MLEVLQNSYEGNAEVYLDTMTRGYTPQHYTTTGLSPYRRPRFRRTFIPLMMQDPRVAFGMRMICGPIFSRTRFFLDCPDPVQAEFIKNTYARHWRNAAARTIKKTLTWGYSGSEVLYRVKDNMLQYDTLKDLHPADCTLVTLDEEPCGMKVRRTRKGGNIYVGGAKCFWTIHNRQENPYYGISRLFGAYGPWFELVTTGGAYDIRMLYYRKYAFNGDVLYHPIGQYTDQNGVVRDYEIDARNIVERRKTGGVSTFPNTIDPISKLRAWELIPGGESISSEKVLEYGHELKNEMLEGLGVPPEVTEAQGTGAFAGRIVPMIGFYSTLHEIVCEYIDDFDRQVVRPILKLNFRQVCDYEIYPTGIMLSKQEIDGTGGSPGGSSSIPGTLGQQGQDTEQEDLPGQVKAAPGSALPASIIG